MIGRLSVMRNNEIDHQALRDSTHILLSPGPGLPTDSNDLLDVIDKYHKSHNILGVCLGHQAIGVYFGAKLKNLDNVRHGVSSLIEVNNHSDLYQNIPKSFLIGHYHSWVIENLNDYFIVTATDSVGDIMSFRHKKYRLYGLQYHPESILTENGRGILKNWIKSK
jgi:anthranilate synthase component 2